MKYGVNAKVANITVFSREGAISVYKRFCKLFNKYMNMEASVIVDKATEDMRKLGFTAEECEQFEIEVLKETI